MELCSAVITFAYNGSQHLTEYTILGTFLIATLTLFKFYSNVVAKISTSCTGTSPKAADSNILCSVVVQRRSDTVELY